MKPRLYILTLLLFSLVISSCSSSRNKADLEKLEKFWNRFTEAVRTNDTATLAALCEFPMDPDGHIWEVVWMDPSFAQ